MDWHYKKVFYIKYKTSAIEEDFYLIADSMEDAIKKFYIIRQNAIIIAIELSITVAVFEE